jgi:sensor histidine kinase YesM
MIREEYLYLDTISGPWIVRSMMSLAMWFTVYCVFLDLIIHFLLLVFVSTGISSPSD